MADGKDPGQRGRDDDDEPGWVTTLVSVAGALGMNKVRVRWKLRRFVRSQRADRQSLANKVAQVRYEHRVCPHCTAVNDKGEGTCTRCGRALSARPVEIAQRLGVWVPRGTTTALLAVTMLAIFIASLVAQSGGTAFELRPWTLVTHGANLRGTGEPVRDLTSLLVHGGVFHLLIGMFTAAMVGSLLEKELGWALLIPVFLVTGAAGAAASDVLGREGLGLGAAAGVCGLIGCGAVIGQRAGTRRGITYRNELLSVGILVVGFGLFVQTDYRALVPAALAGAVLGYALPRDAIQDRRWLNRAIGVAGIAGLVAVAVVGAGERLPSPSSVPGVPFYALGDDHYMARYAGYSGDADGDDVATAFIMCEAVARVDHELMGMFGGEAAAVARCGGVAEERARCADLGQAVAAEPEALRDELRANLAIRCRTLARIDQMRAQ